MNDVQSTLLEMYKDVKSVLEENEIKFYVHFGTAIGAVRHDGFIPWDDDIDIAVWREDIPRIDRSCPKALTARNTTIMCPLPTPIRMSYASAMISNLP